MPTPTDTPRDRGTRALLANGQVVVVRRLDPTDAAAVRALHEGLGEEGSYFRFLGSRPARLGEFASRMVAGGDNGVAAGAFSEGELLGVANFVPLPGTPDAEVAMAVSPAARARGVGTLLLERLTALARQAGIRHFVGEVAGENQRMLRVFRDFGLPFDLGDPGAERDVVIDLSGDAHYTDAVIERERRAETASLAALLAPRSVAVVGAGRAATSVGHAVLANLLKAGFSGELHAVNPHTSTVLGVPSVPSVTDLPQPPDLAVVCTPAGSVPDVIEACGRRGVRAAVVVSSGLTGTPLADRVRQSVREHGMRLVGPNCIGVANSTPTATLNATFLRGPLPAGRVGLVTQSGGIGIAVTELLSSLGLGLSALVSTGDKYDVSGNDLLLWWLNDPATDAVVLYLESFGNPRKFGRIARAVARRKPVIAVRSASTAAGQRAAASHTAATATPAVSRDALFDQAGVTTVDSLSELSGVLAILAWQPLPPGSRVGIVGNAGGIGVLAADACQRHGLAVADLAPATVETLRELLPASASPHNPVDTTAAVGTETFAACLRAVLADDGVDIVLAAASTTAVGDPAEAIADTARHGGKPLIAIRAGQLAAVAPLHDSAGVAVTACVSDPDLAVASLACLARYAAWRDEPAGTPAEPAGIDADRARELVHGWLADNPAGGWLDPATVDAVLRAFGVPVVPGRTAAGESDAVAAARAVGYPVAVKAVAEGLLHKASGGGVMLSVSGDDAVRGAFRVLRERFGRTLRAVVVQPMAPDGRELLAGISNDGVFGPLVVFGLGGTDTDIVDDRAARLVPITDADARRLVHGLRSSPRVFADIDTTGVEDVLLRLGRMAEELPEIAEADLNPVRLTPTASLVLDARIRIEPRPDPGEFPRALRG